MIGVSRRRAWISRVANLILRLAFLAPVHDLTTGYRAYRAAASIPAGAATCSCPG